MASVEIYVYDLSQGMMAAMSQTMLGKRLDGLWHTSVVAYGTEYYFGGGIQQARPGTTSAGRPVRVLKYGETEVPKWLLHEQLEGMKAEFTSETYHLLDNNCNTFANELAHFLTGKGLPDHILDLPKEFASSPLGPILTPMIDSFFRSGGGGGGAPV